MEELIKEYEDRIPDVILNNLRKEILNIKITKKQLEEVLIRLEEVYEKSRINSGESIGIITAESFGEPATQMTLNVFHFAGVSEMGVSTGLPRLIEIFDARKTIKTPMMYVYLKSPYNKDAQRVRKVAGSIKEINLREISTQFSINIPKLQVEVSLNTKKMKRFGLDEKTLLKIISEALKTIDVKLGTDKLILKSKNAENELFELYKIKEKSKVIHVAGIKGVKQVSPVKSGNEFMILTAGTNLKSVFKINEVDENRTVCNDLYEIRKVLGVEAARQVVIEEASKVMQEQGLDVDLRHIMFIADIITSTGEIKGITRSGITGEKESVLARASFETPIKHIVNASLIGEVDKLNSVIENVMINQQVPLGTGLPDLVVKMIGDKKWQ